MHLLAKIFKNLSKTEQLIFICAALAFIVAGTFFGVNFIYQNSALEPVSGGEYVEGVLGQPSFINPVLAADSGSDRDLSEILFSNLSDLMENHKMSGNGKIWNVRLKDNIFWDDKEVITSDDIILTIKTIQDPDSRSSQASMWQGVLAERVSEREVKITLPSAYVFFEATLRDLKVIPKHIFGSIPAANLRLSDYNFEPVGDGPFRYDSMVKERSGFISQYQLVRNERYFGDKPYLDKIIFKFYQNEDDLTKAFNAGLIDGVGGLNQKGLSQIGINHQTFELHMPRYYAIFFNQSANGILKDKNIRLALDYATDKTKIIDSVFNGQAMATNGPLVLGMAGYDAKVESQQDDFSLDKAGEILSSNGWQLNSDGVAEKFVNKQPQDLEFTLILPDVPALQETANIIKDNWQKIGVKLNLSVRPSDEINSQIIQTRNYEMLLWGNIFENYDSPDLSSFWHSSERFYPGLNLTLYQNSAADNLLQGIRVDFNAERRQAELSSLQSLIIADQPVVFLFSPNYIYVTINSLNGFDGSTEKKFIASANERFKDIEKWYVKTARVFK